MKKRVVMVVLALVLALGLSVGAYAGPNEPVPEIRSIIVTELK